MQIKLYKLTEMCHKTIREYGTGDNILVFCILVAIAHDYYTGNVENLV